MQFNLILLFPLSPCKHVTHIYINCAYELVDGSKIYGEENFKRLSLCYFVDGTTVLWLPKKVVLFV